MRRHLEGAQLQQAQAAGGRVRRVQLVDAELAAVGVAGDVDQQVAQLRSTSQGGMFSPTALLRSISPRAISSSRSWSLRASSTRGAWLVGPMNRPENR
jgi:hypothetical protein